MVPIFKSLITIYSFVKQNLVLLSQSEQSSQNLTLNRCTKTRKLIDELFCTYECKACKGKQTFLDGALVISNAIHDESGLVHEHLHSAQILRKNLIC